MSVLHSNKKEKMKNESMLGKWDRWYKSVKNIGSFRYGNTETYKLAADFLGGMEVEDWGCGTGGFKRVYPVNYTGLDGSKTPFVHTVVDLREYQSNVDGIMMRHVLEHNYDWKRILSNAVSSFNKKFCLIIFTPFSDETHEIAHNKSKGVDVPTISFSRYDIERFFKGLNWRYDELQTKTAYNVENIYYIQR